MPNYCESKLIISGSSQRIHQLEAERFTRENHLYFLDFNKVIPMPKPLDIESGSNSSFAHELLYPKTNPGDMGDRVNKAWTWLAFRPGSLPENSNKPEDIEGLIKLLKQTERGRQLLYLGLRCERNLRLYGSIDWYKWRIGHWGTKWNCTDFSIEELGIYYLSTAWSPPTPVISELANLYPDLNFKLSSLEMGAWYACESFWVNGQALYEDYDLDVKEMAISTFGFIEEEFTEDE